MLLGPFAVEVEDEARVVSGDVFELDLPDDEFVVHDGRVSKGRVVKLGELLAEVLELLLARLELVHVEERLVLEDVLGHVEGLVELQRPDLFLRVQLHLAVLLLARLDFVEVVQLIQELELDVVLLPRSQLPQVQLLLVDSRLPLNLLFRLLQARRLNRMQDLEDLELERRLQNPDVPNHRLREQLLCVDLIFQQVRPLRSLVSQRQILVQLLLDVLDLALEQGL